MSVITGISASQGVAIGKVFLKKEEQVRVPIYTLAEAEIPKEIARLKEGLDKTAQALQNLHDKAKADVGEDEARIFDVHRMLLLDDEFVEHIETTIQNERVNAEEAVAVTEEVFANMFANMEDAYLRERAADIKDISKRLILNLLGQEEKSVAGIDYEAIIVAKDLYPSDTIQINKNFVKGLITLEGGKMSHTAILARTMQLPAVVGVGEAGDEIQEGDILILDAKKGEIIINPSEAEIEEFKKKQAEFEAYQQELLKYIGTESVTSDGQHIEICANIGRPSDVPAVLENDAEGVGLFRSEFLYMDSPEMPTEEEQYQAYKIAVEGLGGKRVIIRTLDVGGDKEIPYLNIPKEENPFLGYRAVRVCLEMKDLFKTQLRALLRSSVHGKLAIMIPMIISVDEVRRSKELIAECKAELLAEGVAVSDDIEVGIMIETPAAVMVADLLAKEVDFFSVGTNDLTQYILAADRMNPKIADLYDTCNPAVLRAIKKVADDAHEAGIWIGICGESGADTRLTGFFAAIGIDELSVSPSSVLEVRKTVQSINAAEQKANLHQNWNI
ncbi:MAG: phosphoenolpyruvate--protein phosphotransferase [Epulopiscium sp. Nele67-Bin005]|nr:MAG: phosphoenolpyruvate--protein phosphotransferase [Epulopiscium sp. Nele67-Bin005]